MLLKPLLVLITLFIFRVIDRFRLFFVFFLTMLYTLYIYYDLANYNVQ